MSKLNQIIINHLPPCERKAVLNIARIYAGVSDLNQNADFYPTEFILKLVHVVTKLSTLVSKETMGQRKARVNSCHKAVLALNKL